MSDTLTTDSKDAPVPGGRKFPTGVVLLILGIGAAAVVVHSVSKASAADEQKKGGAPPPPEVTVSVVEQRKLIEHRDFIGRVEAIESVEVRPRVSGHIDEVKLVSGQIVEKGDLLFQIDPRWYKAQFDLATAEVARAQVRVEITGRDSARAQGLLGAKAVSVEQADTRESLLAEAKAELLSAQANLETARLDLDYTQVRSPIHGRVSRALVTAGNLVSGVPGGGTLLTTIVSTGEAYVYADVDESTSLAFERLKREGALPMVDGRVQVDMQLVDESGYPRHGFIESAHNRLDEGTGTLVYRMVFPDPGDKLVPGLFARVRLPVSAEQATLLVNERSIGTDQSQKFVFTVGTDNAVSYKAVKLGPVIDGKRVIREGLQADERVIVSGLQRVRPGVKVTAAM